MKSGIKSNLKPLLRLALLLVTLFAVGIPAAKADPATDDINSVLSLEGSFFHPRRQKFRDFYGQGFPVFGARFDFRYHNTTWICLKGRFVKMSETNGPDFTNVSLGLLLKKDISQERNINLYAAIGPQLDYRRISMLQNSGTNSGERVSQTEWSPSIALETGLDFWLPPDVKISPHVDFTYFPFGDPTRGDFGDTGGFYFTQGIGFRI